MPHSPPELPLEGVEGRQLQRHRVQSLQRQMADALVAVSSLANVLGKCQFVVDHRNPSIPQDNGAGMKNRDTDL